MDDHPVEVKLRPPSDVLGVLFLLAMGLPLYWDRVRGGRHLSRVDIVNQFLPNYAYLGERLRSGDLPGWNPYLSSGAPFLGDAQSGWGYLPAMVTFSVLPPFRALQANYFIHIFLAGIGAYALSRLTGIGVWGAITAGLAFEYGSILALLRAVNVGAQLIAWIPFAFVGVEIALRATNLRSRALGWGLSGLAISQMIVGWTGQGSAYAMLIVGSYIGVRMLCQAASHWMEISTIFVRHLVDGFAIAFFGSGLSAAGLWIRFVVNQDSVIDGGDYSRAAGASQRAGYLPPTDLINHVLRPSSHDYVGAATLSLAFLAFFTVQQERWRVWIYGILAFLTVDLVVAEPIVRPWIFRLPALQQLHEHAVPKALLLLGLPLALLAGMTVDALVNWKGDWHHLAGLAFVPIFAAAGVSYWLRQHDPGVFPEPRTAAITVGLIIFGFALILAARPYLPNDVFRIAQDLAIVALLVAIAWDPFGDQFGKRLPTRTMVLPPSQTFETYLSKNDPRGPGRFLQQQMATEGPFRFFGYGPSILATDGPRSDRTYHGRFRDKLVVELLFSRNARLGLPNVQGYNPVQNKRYTDFLVAVNGEPQNYHDANILSEGVDSPLLRLLHVRYIIVQRQQSWKYDEIRTLEGKYPVVFEDGTVRVLEVTDALPHSWIVHEAVRGSREDALAFIQTDDFDPTSIAFIEGPLPKLKKTNNPDNEHVDVADYGADRIELSATLRTAGIVVLSEIYAQGWQAYVDGKPAEIYATDYVLRGVVVPAGEHTIILKYAPPAIIRGIGITLGSMLLLFCLIAQPWRLRFGFVRRLHVPWRVNDRQGYRGPDTDGLTARSSSPNHQGDWPQPGQKRRQPVI